MSDKIKVAISWFGDCMGDGTPIYDIEEDLDGVEEDEEYDGTRIRELTQKQIDFINKTQKDWWEMQRILEKAFDSK